MTGRSHTDTIRGSAGWKSLVGLTMGCMVAANLFLFVPLTLYLGNVDDFNSPLLSILGNFVPPFVILVLCVALIGFFLPPNILRHLVTLLAALSLLLWLQGNVLVWDYGVLDGRAIDWGQARWRGWIDSTIWIALLGVAVGFPRRAAKPFLVAAITIVVIQAASVGIAILEQPEVVFRHRDRLQEMRAADSMYRFSTSKNVLHIVLDGVQTDIFDEVIHEGETGKRFRDALDGFVFFKDHLGAFPYTHMSVPALLTGQIYKNQLTRTEFFNRTIARKSILTAASEAGFEVDIAAAGILNFYTRGGYTNAYAISSHQHVARIDYEFGESAKLLDVTLFRLAPHFVKKYVYNDQLWLLQALLANSRYEHLEFFAHNAFLREFQTRMTVDRSRPVYKIFHLMVSHTPFIANEECGYAGGIHRITRQWVKLHVRCSVGEVVHLLDKMKALGIYADATIVLMADHGAWVRPNGLWGENHRSENSQVVLNHPTTVAMATPLMAVKAPGATGPLRVSMAPSAIVDVPDTIASLLGLPTNFGGQSMFDLDESAARERRHYSYTYSRAEWDADYLAPVHEFIVNGPVLDGAAWKEGPAYSPPGHDDQ